MPQHADRAGKEARGKVVAGLGLEMLRISIPLIGNTDLGHEIAITVGKLGRRLQKPPEDLGQSELKFMGSQLYPPPQAPAEKAGGLPPTPPPPPSAPAQAASA
jgi:hypothetical protein